MPTFGSKPPQEAALLRAHSLSKTVSSGAKQIAIVSDVSLQLQAGESLAIVGASGSGKTTLLGLLAGLDTPSEGKVQLAGTELSSLDEDGRAALRAAELGFVFQDFHLLPALNALDNVLLPLELQAGNLKLSRSERIQRATAQLTAVGLAQRLKQFPRQLSGGEQQRVALARAFITQPNMLFCDEPTGSLDAETGKQVIDLLFKLNQEQRTTLVLVTHDHQLAARCDRRIEMVAGRLKP